MRFTIVFLVLALAVMMTKACPCPKIYDPVCASNHKSYANPCLFKCEVNEAKKEGKENAENELFIVHRGRCTENPEEEQKDEDDFLNLYQ